MNSICIQSRLCAQNVAARLLGDVRGDYTCRAQHSPKIGSHWGGVQGEAQLAAPLLSHLLSKI